MDKLLHDFQEWMDYLTDIAVETPSEVRRNAFDQTTFTGARNTELWRSLLSIWLKEAPITHLLELAKAEDWQATMDRVIDGLVAEHDDTETWRQFFKSQMGRMIEQLREMREKPC